MFASFKSEDRNRGTQILVADKPQGPFEPITTYPVTPEEWMALDGTFYIEEGKPYMVFCHEWVQIKDGSMEVMLLSDDLKTAAAPPVTIFHASDAPWVRPHKPEQFVTDGPYLFKRRGRLLMLWSSMGEQGYAMGLAESTSGSIHGPWKHLATPVYKRDGGHGIIFEDLQGNAFLTLHSPNHPDGAERPMFIPVSETLDKILDEE